MDDNQLDLVFGALADRTRRAILARLAETDSNVGDLTALFTMSQPAVSRHLKVLEQAGLVSRTRQGTMRLSHLEAEPLKQATGWLGGYREYWEASYARLDELLGSLDEDRTTTTQARTQQGEVR